MCCSCNSAMIQRLNSKKNSFLFRAPTSPFYKDIHLKFLLAWIFFTLKGNHLTLIQVWIKLWSRPRSTWLCPIGGSLDAQTVQFKYFGFGSIKSATKMTIYSSFGLNGEVIYWWRCWECLRFETCWEDVLLTKWVSVKEDDGRGRPPRHPQLLWWSDGL